MCKVSVMQIQSTMEVWRKKKLLALGQRLCWREGAGMHQPGKPEAPGPTNTNSFYFSSGRKWKH